MKILILGLALLLSASCQETTQGYEGLTSGEKANVAYRYAQKCNSDSDDLFEANKRLSNKQFDTSESVKFYPQKTWKYDYPSIKEVRKITVWKVDPANVYLLETTDLDSAISYRFIKISKQTNTDMIEDVQTQYCSKAATISITGNGGVLTNEVTAPVTAVLAKRTTKTFTYDFNLLAYFSFYKYTKKVEDLDITDNNRVTATDNSTGTLSLVADETFAYANYTGYTGAQFCIVTYVAGTPNTYTLPYTLNCAPTVPEFDPTTEL